MWKWRGGLKVMPGKYAESMIEMYEEKMGKVKVQKLPCGPEVSGSRWLGRTQGRAGEPLSLISGMRNISLTGKTRCLIHHQGVSIHYVLPHDKQFEEVGKAHRVSEGHALASTASSR